MFDFARRRAEEGKYTKDLGFLSEPNQVSQSLTSERPGLMSWAIATEALPVGAHYSARKQFLSLTPWL